MRSLDRVTSPAQSSISVRQREIAAACLAGLFGLIILLFSGFIGADIVHNSAHDARHANGFPCH